MKRLFAALCLILILPLLLAQYSTFYPDIDRFRGARLKTREVMPPLVARAGSRTLDSLRGLG